MNRQQAADWLTEQLDSIYRALQHGQDVSPARILKLEGVVEWLIAQNLLDWVQVQQQTTQVYRQYLGEEPSALHWQWCQDDQLFRLPYRMQTAPVS